jgi:GNAT superfamily N-acetyltransferase
MATDGMPAEAAVTEWTRDHPDFGRLGALFDRAEDAAGLWEDFDWEEQVLFLVALWGGEPAGLLKLTVHPIGADMGTEPVRLRGETLREAKVMEFVVAPARRRRGLGRLLQEAAIARARGLGCYQLRSHSGGDRAENHRLKLAMGFAVDPIIRGGDHAGAYFLLPLRDHP